MTADILEAIIRDDSDFSISIKVEEDESITIDWDEHHEIAKEMKMNEWTPEDWIKFLQEYLEKYPTEEGEAFGG